ncbi:hypothetical protein [Scandinavium goeteborgense]|uniref:Lipoprotein n=1 Tax=Scandinavium goeteborgense TaxID=1851514 RepID=A0A4R6DSK6_SCAGO|nr:hypothetical protein [Scandinavium goeteborgense]TDN48066.1 hypothetical protein EC847_12817 [Scandinavium goeteborgense]
MKKVIFALLVTCVLSGCTTSMKGGSGQIYNLSERHVIYRDLTAPVSLGNEPVKPAVVSTPGIAP